MFFFFVHFFKTLLLPTPYPPVTALLPSPTPSSTHIPLAFPAGPMPYLVILVLTPVLIISISLIVAVLIWLKRKHRHTSAIPDNTSSGSGSGKPYLVARTISRSINLQDIVLGHGRFGLVHLGYYLREPVAVKRLRSTNEKSWRCEVIAFELCMQHDAIVGFVASDMFSLDGCTEYWLVTRYHPYGSLHSYLRKRREEKEGEGGGGGGGEGGGGDATCTLSKADLLRMASSACSGLVHLHTPIVNVGFRSKPIMAHRDLKSSNILVKSDLTCCIADMGLAVFDGWGLEEAEMQCPGCQGTRRYMSPEILTAESFPHKMSVDSLVRFYVHADVYAMALVIWEMCRRMVTDTGNWEICNECHLYIPKGRSLTQFKHLSTFTMILTHIKLP